MKYLYLFILGRNPELSKAELYSFLKISGIKISRTSEKGNSILLEIDNEIKKEELEHLGGIISAGKVISDISKHNKKELNEKLKTVYNGTKNNITYAIWNFSSDKNYEFVADYLKEKFREEKFKASRKNLTRILELQNEQKISIVGNDVDEEFFVFDEYFGRIFFITNYESLEFRDISKPHRRESLAISPRLAKIMINLSEAKKDDKIIDAFCGIGVILSEALLQGIKAAGIDRDKGALEMATENLKWLKINKEDYNLIENDSGKIKLTNQVFHSLVSEPEFGETLKEIPPSDKAHLILSRYENLLINVLNNLKHYVKHRFVFTAPYILTKDRRISCNINKIATACGLKIVCSYKEFRKKQIVGREIFVLEH